MRDCTTTTTTTMMAFARVRRAIGAYRGPRTRRAKSKDKRPRDAKLGADEKRPRTAFTNEQLEKLRQEFQSNSYLDEKRRKNLADRLCLNENQIKIWFQNKRAKIKKQSSQPNPLRGLLVAGGLYNHSTATSECSESYANGLEDGDNNNNNNNSHNNGSDLNGSPLNNSNKRLHNDDQDDGDNNDGYDIVNGDDDDEDDANDSNNDDNNYHLNNKRHDTKRKRPRLMQSPTGHDGRHSTMNGDNLARLAAQQSCNNLMADQDLDDDDEQVISVS